MSGLLTLDEAATVLRCNPKTVQREIGRGNLVASMVAGRWLVKPEDIDRYLKATANVKRSA